MLKGSGRVRLKGALKGSVCLTMQVGLGSAAGVILTEIFVGSMAQLHFAFLSAS
jgi:hypothetical protein